MRNPLVCVVALIAAMVLTGCASARGRTPLAADSRTTEAERRDAILHARVWTPTDVASMDIMAGPSGSGAFAPDAAVACVYVDKPITGRSPKFTCVISPDDEVKVKFGADNGEVFAEVAATRLLWALGFGADRVYPVRVTCQGCPAGIPAAVVATIQRKMPGKDIETGSEVGWKWPELERLDREATAESRAERDALKLLAAFLQHTDSKAEQQRLVCTSGGKDSAPCTSSFMMVHDVGLTFGAANKWNRNSVGSVNLDQWSQVPVWKDARRCIANLSKSHTGTLDHPVISEAGRHLLASLLAQLTDTQLHDLFVVARFSQKTESATGPPSGSSVEAWVAEFKRKRADIANNVCAAAGSASGR